MGNMQRICCIHERASGMNRTLVMRHLFIGS